LSVLATCPCRHAPGVRPGMARRKLYRCWEPADDRYRVCGKPGAACPKWEVSTGRCRTGDVAAMLIGTIPLRDTFAACVPGKPR
jgi:hypothetical protein